MANELEKLRSEANQLNNDYLRSLAEFDNFRRRKERELQEFREFANEQLLLELIPILDNFERAAQATETGGQERGGECMDDSLRKGIKLIFRQLRESLARCGLCEYSCLGEVFDPRRCEAISFQELDDKPENTVIGESAKGYTYKSKVLRPAMVVVAKPKTTGEEKPPVNAGGHNAKS